MNDAAAAAASEPPGLRARKKAEARAALVAAALGLFAARGFHAVTVDEIAAAAGVSRRSFFRYFPTKEAVVLERRREQLALLERRLAAAPARAPVAEVVKVALGALEADYEAHKRRVLAERALFAPAPGLALADLEIDRAFEAALAAAVAPRLGRGEVARRRARMFAAALVAMMRVALEDWAERKGRAPLRAFAAEAVEAALALLDRPAARA
ncbi:MAG: TetR family transcriptional regulator [Myxococcales bacterium]|nr:TetR family transcriptional regulator [Myxococcales bacterium]